MECYELLFQVPWWLCLAASNMVTELCGGDILWWEVVFGDGKIMAG